MINAESFTQQWINENRTRLKCDPVLLEKCIQAFSLLCYLKQTKIDFVFKGGTSLLLHLNTVNRLSIDVDIVSGNDPSTFKDVAEEITNASHFSRYEENERGDRGLPKRQHFKFFFDSVYQNREDYVLLDIVEESLLNLPCIEKPVITDFVEVEQETLVKIPTIDALTADKLTAFAPHTIGVPFSTPNGDSMTMQVVKQLFDVGILFDYIEDIAIVKNSYKHSFDLENGYRDNKYSMEGVLQDSQVVALDLCRFAVKGCSPNNDSIKQLHDGVNRIQSHLIGKTFTKPIGVKIAAAKVFLLTKLLSGEIDLDTSNLKYDHVRHLDFVEKTNLPDPYNDLTRLKIVNPEAFYYLALGCGLHP